jgi:translocation and assembly module TamB
MTHPGDDEGREVSEAAGEREAPRRRGRPVSRLTRTVAIVAGSVLALVALVGLAVVAATNTDWGRERVRRFALGALDGVVHGIVTVGRVEGNLLEGVTLRDVAITDSAGQPFLAAQSLSARYAIRDFVRKRIYLRDVRIVRPVIVLDRPPDGEWNWARIFPGDTTPSADTTLGFGDWVAFRDAQLVEGHLVVRTPWAPDDSLRAAARDSAVAHALSAASRTRVERARGGFQQVMEFREVTGRFPDIIIRSPAMDAMLFDVATARLVALPFRPPAAELRDLRGAFHVADDSIYWRDVAAALPGSRITRFSGAYILTDTLAHDEGDMWMTMRGERVALADLRWLYPRLPGDGGGTIAEFRMAIRGDSSDYVATDAEVRTGRAALAGDFGLAMADSMRFHDTDLRFSGIDTRLVEQLAPAARSPRRGTISGRAALAGTTAALRVDADVAFDDASAGTSRVAAVGEVGFADGFRARALRVRAYPVQVALARVALPDFPLAGTLTGTATLTGDADRWLVGSADLEHRDRGAYSHLIGTAEVGLGATTALDVRVRAAPVALATVGRFVPALGLQGSATGTIRARGTTRDLAVEGDLGFPDGGALAVSGRAGIERGEPWYDLFARLRLFNARAVVARAPRTSLTAVASARGRGTDPATMRATFAADAARSDVDSVGVDTLHARLAIADGMATVDSLVVGAPYGRATARGTFGTAPGREGTLAYRVAIDSLAGLGRWIPGLADTTVIAPRPGRVARAVREARADSAELARRTEVERAALGGPAPRLRTDTIPGIRRDSVAGAIHAAGTVRGGLKGFDLRGRAALEGIIARGRSVRHAAIEYALDDALTRGMSVVAAASLDSVEATGFLIDSADVRLSFRQPEGRIELAVVQNEREEYLVRGDFALHTDHSELHLRDLRLRFDTTQWVAARPAAIRWGARGIEIVDLDLRSGELGRIYADGRIPASGPAALDVAISGFQIGDVVSMLQSDIEATGLLTVTARLEGTREAPTLRGAVGVVAPSYRGTALPDARLTMRYADQSLAADLEAIGASGLRLARAEATLPVNLALAGVTGPRFPDRPLAVDVVADSLPLDALPKFTDAVSDIRGRVTGAVAVRGTKSHPELVGNLALDLGHARLVPTGVHYEDINGSIWIRDDVVHVDSLRASAGDGWMRVRGTIDIADPARPGFALGVDADDALVLDNEQGRVFADAGVDVEGPFDSVLVQGGARVLRGVVYIPNPDAATALSSGDPAVFNVIDTSLVANRELLPRESPLLKNLRVDVNVRIDRGTFARNADGNVELHTPEDGVPLHIAIDRSRDAITVDGVVATERGEYSVAGRRFTLSRGSVTFIGQQELDPLIQLIGEREIQIPGREALIIRVIVGGTARHPRLSLESTAQPPISQSDLLSYLAFGRSSSSLLQFQGSSLSGPGSGSGQLVGDVAALATRQLAAVALGAVVQDFQRDAARDAGLDLLTITPSDIPPELLSGRNVGSGVGQLVRGTEIEAGKYINVSTFVATQVSGNGIPGARIEHRMKKGFRLEAAVEPRYEVRVPSLSQSDVPSARAVFGAFLIHERRF